MRKYTLIFIVLTLVLAACRIESNIGLDIAEDGSAKLTIEVGFDDEFLALLGSQGGGFTEDDLLGDLISGTDGEFTERREGDMNYFATTTDIADLSTWDGDVDTAGFSNFSYSFDDEGARLSASLVPDDSSGLGGDLGFDPSAITDDFISANLVVTMPGTVTSHNADEVRNGALVWNIGLTGTTEVSAESTFGGSDFPWLVILLIVVLIAALVGAIVALIVSRKSNERQLAAIHAAKAAQLTSEEPVTPAVSDGSVVDEVADEMPDRPDAEAAVTEEPATDEEA
jgi:hypothetical protein